MTCLVYCRILGLTGTFCVFNRHRHIGTFQGDGDQDCRTPVPPDLQYHKKVPLIFLVLFVAPIHNVPNLVLSTHLPFNYCCNVSVSKGKKHFMK